MKRVKHWISEVNKMNEKSETLNKGNKGLSCYVFYSFMLLFYVIRLWIHTWHVNYCRSKMNEISEICKINEMSEINGQDK